MMKGEWPIELKDKDKVPKADQRPKFRSKWEASQESSPGQLIKVGPSYYWGGSSRQLFKRRNL